MEIGGEIKGKLTVEFEEKPKIYVDSWCGNWNKDWTKGDKIEFVLEKDKDQNKNLPWMKITDWEKGEKSGKNYMLYAPETAKFGGASKEEIEDIKERLDLLETRVDELEAPTETEEKSNIKEVVDEIPFGDESKDAENPFEED